MSVVVTLEEKLRRAKIDNVTSQQAIRRSRNLTLGSKQKIAKAKDGKSARDKDDNLSRKIPLEYAAEIRQQAREIRQKSKQVHAKSRQIRETVESRSGSRS
jgi:hypothetical protein